MGGQSVFINAGLNRPVYLEMVVALKSQFDAMLSFHSRVVVINMIIKVPRYTEDNKLISDFMRKLIKKIRRRISRQGWAICGRVKWV